MSANRISTKTLYEAIAASVGARNQQILKLQLSVADGRAVRTPSDDPVRAHQAMWYRQQIRASAQYERSLQSVTTSISAAENTLANVSDVLSEVRDLQVRGSNDAMEGDARSAYAAQVNQDLELLLSLANDRFAGTYTFGGRNNQQAPYRAARDASGKITRVVSNPAGIDGKLIRKVGPDVLLSVNVPGADLFGEGGSAFQALIDLRTALESGSGDKIRAMGAPMETALDRAVQAGSVLGALQGRVQALLGRSGDEQIGYENGRSQAEDLDVAQAMVLLQQEQAALQAALKSGSQIINLSLLDYMPVQ
jgi:flagellar hook-associated protein 3 FlgL